MFDKKLCDLLKARFSIIYIPTYEENRVLQSISLLVKDPVKIKTVRDVFVWTWTDGFVSVNNDEGKKAPSDSKDPVKALDFIQKYKDPSVFIMRDLHVLFGSANRPGDANLIRKFRDIAPIIRQGISPKTIIITCPITVIPVELQKEISILDYPLPDFKHIYKVLDEIIEANRETGRIKINVDSFVKERLVKAAQGLTLQEAENSFARAMVEDGKLDINDVDIIFEEKRQIIKKTGILEFINSEVKIEDVGGLENIKKWLKKRNRSWLDDAAKYCLPNPKGMLITGVPGCGKSLIAKAVSSMWQLPLLRLDMGKIFQGIVGSSEENMRKALNTAEAVSPSILWIDEIEKGFSGTGGSGDSGVTARIFGTFLTWMQEKEKPVFVIATANNISALPPEFLRKGRFDEIFFVDIPTEKERENIFLLHAVKRLKNKEVVGNFKLSKDFLKFLAKHTEGFVGAEIEQIVINALFEAFSESRSINSEDFVKAVKNIVPLSITMAEDIMRLREWANVRAVSATAKEDRKNYEMDGNNISEEIIEDDKQGIYKERGGRTVDI
ncbi:MAG: AAA family ATPase [Candidatus Muirbacterium halophilum]|nr:AAA family ATPase [Candidatus Muirbacterium halophilum]MCK9477401.1 AAA family ATPase [Candidatus Muirbacterium halophilum]